MTLTLKVSDMKCSNCAAKISESIQTIEPNAKIDVDLDSKIVSVDSAADGESIKQAVVAAGFNVES